MRLVGSGGQGVVLGALILAEGAAAGGRHIAQTQSYGAQARGGAVSADIVIGAEKIDYPLAIAPDLLIILEREFGAAEMDNVSEDGWIIIDGAENGENSRALAAPIVKTAAETAGREGSANMVAVGVAAGFTRVFDEEALREIISRRVPQKTVEANLRAFDAGLKLGASLKRKTKKLQKNSAALIDD